MPETRQPTRKQRILGGLLGQLPPGSFQQNPFFPDLLNQPDLLVAPAPGKIVAVFLYGYSYSLGWQSALAALEDLFEVKLNIGRTTTAIAIDLSESNQDFEQDDMRRLLRNTFETFIHADFWKSEISGNRFWSTVQESIPRQDLFHLWDMEREFVQDSLRRFSKERYLEIVDKRRPPRLSKGATVSRVASAIEEATGTAPEREPLVDSVKASLGSLYGRYKLGFDLMSREPTEVPIQVIRVGRHPSRDTVRYLMTKARLMRYRGEGDRLERLWNRARPLLVVEGNLAGPDHDPFRYVRSLVSAGWEVMSADAANSFPRVLRDANL